MSKSRPKKSQLCLLKYSICIWKANLNGVSQLSDVSLAFQMDSRFNQEVAFKEFSIVVGSWLMQQIFSLGVSWRIFCPLVVEDTRVSNKVEKNFQIFYNQTVEPKN